MRRLPLLALAAMSLAAGCAGRPPVTTPSAVAEEVPAAAASATAATTKSEAAPAEVQTQDESGEQNDGVVHIVQPGQTVWRIARAYGVSIDTLAQANGINDITRVEVGQPLFIPGARATIDVAPYPAPAGPPHVATTLHSAPGELLWPVDGGEFMRPFGEPRRNHIHAGVDIRGARGQSILAARDGVVAFSGPTRGGYGNMVILDHGDGLQTVYAHAQKALVHAGDAVRRGDPIALVGRTGNATTEHCHFEVRLENRPVDPMPFLQATTQARN